MSRARWTEFEAFYIPDDLRGFPDDRGWVNSLYQVVESPMAPGWIHLSVKRRDGNPVHDWRDLQRIKNELVGPEAEAVELYPAESRLVDAANRFHLWCSTTQGKFPFGFSHRLVSEGACSPEHGSSRQRPWPEGERPADCLVGAATNALVDAHLAREREKKAGAP